MFINPITIKIIVKATQIAIAVAIAKKAQSAIKNKTKK